MIDLLGPGLTALYTAVYWPNSHLTFPCNLQLGKQQHSSKTRSCPGQRLSWEKTLRRNILLGCAGAVWAHTGRVIFTGHWDKWISGSCIKLLYQNIFWPLFIEKKPPDFQGASSKASAPILVEQLPSAAFNSKLRNTATKHSSQHRDIFSLGTCQLKPLRSSNDRNYHSCRLIHQR